MHHQLLSAAVLLAASAGGALANPGVPKGVDPKDAQLYTPTGSDQHFTCLTHPSITIPFSAVNDDYCDCPDGSDEPGTSACAHLPHAQLAVKGFYCANQPGSIPQYLPLNRVNDGVCDYEICCDGSDEYNHVGGLQCENRCKEIGAKVKQLLGERWKVRNEGGKKRAELIEKAKVMRGELEAGLKQLEVVIEGLEKKHAGLLEEVKVVEVRERAKAVKASKKTEKTNIVREIAQQRIDELKVYLQKLRDDERDLRERLTEAEKILEGLKQTYNPNFNDEGVKGAVRKWDDYVAEGKSVARSDAEERDLDDLLNGEGIDWDELMPAQEEEEEILSIYRFEEYLPKNMKDWVRQKMDEARKFLVDNGLLAEHIPPTTHEPTAVLDAKAAASAAETELTAKRNSLTNSKSELSKDYGPYEVFRSLKGVCIDRDVGEYKYEFCFFEKAYQRSLKDSSSSFLGDHQRIEITPPSTSATEQEGIFPCDDVDEAHEEKLSGWVLHYDGGSQCWNGPKRSARIELYCAVENEIRSVVETEKCVYTYEVGTPVVCEGEKSAEEKMGEQVRDEL
ncbi:glucosidase II beta subunit-like-domain-containing protein [Terfezia claveryi]|nr:glucosidase II beta subunit-like-domain-containing protein [Terfezia claveryi]